MNRQTKSTCQRGFSIVELVMVMGIIVLMSAIAIPFFGGFMANRDLKNAARDLAGDIFAARQGSLSDKYQGTQDSATYRIDFNTPGANQYTISQCKSDGSGPCISQGSKSPSAFRSEIVISAAPAAIVFTSRGTASATGDVTLSMTSRTSTATISTSTIGRTSVNWNLH